jgi:hypothetical protein
MSGVDSVLGHYAKKLAGVASRVDSVIEAGRADAGAGARELEGYLDSLRDEDLTSDIGLIFDFLRESDREVTERVLPALSDVVLVRLLTLQGAAARSGEIGPERLLAAVGIKPGATREAVVEGARLLAINSSGNFAIDMPYTLAVYDVIEGIGESDPASALDIIMESGTKQEPWLERGSSEMLSIFRRAPERAAGILASQGSLYASPQRRIHQLISLDPDLAADIAALFSGPQSVQTGLFRLTEDTPALVMLEMAYDAYWGERGGPAVVPALDARFLARLDEVKGAAWLDGQFDGALALLRDQPEFAEFESELRRTLTEAASSTASAEARAIAQRLADRGA